MSLLEVSMKGTKELKHFLNIFPNEVALASRDAVNSAAKFAFAESSRQIRSQVNLTREYIGAAGAGNRLRITKPATLDNPTAKIAARMRPVSLARFAETRALGGRRGVRVMVKPGRRQQIPKAFIVKLKSGKTMTEDQFNLGLVIRLPKGESPSRRFQGKPFGSKDSNLFLLYGPSVDQVFQTVRDDVEPAVVNHLTNEFLRQMERRLRG